MQLKAKTNCGKQKHSVSVTVYDFETVQQVTGVAYFKFDGSATDISNQVSRLIGNNGPDALRVCRQACCEVAANATGLKDVEEILNV